ncbi:M20/M25/M40 family metallo-hydrolase [Kineococcus sp. NBC_00420]|uniref:M20 family metallopeptidase n=1 Tax=Kineococcus sp. NBC_00420 TaxID=2903564 RepID=UPI002E2049B3
MDGLSAVVDLAAQLIACDTSHGGEDDALHLIATQLTAAGFDLHWVPWRPGRSNLVAHHAHGAAFTFAAHLDTVPFTADGWSFDPLGAQVLDGRLYGRGSSDMKAATAAMLLAAVDAAERGCRPFSMVFTSGEETGCHGARAVHGRHLLHTDPLLIVGEATGNQLRLGHKGATWLEVNATGRSAHGSRPDLGVNAIEMISALITRLSLATAADATLGPSHPLLGSPTVNVGTITGGQQTNLVPDHCQMSLDVRTVHPDNLAAVLKLLHHEGVVLTETVNVPSVWSEPSTATAQAVLRAVQRSTGRPQEPRSVPYFTDGAVLAGRQPHVFIIGPGDPDQPHTTDESCSVVLLHEAVSVYTELLTSWDTGQLTPTHPAH